jgi:hypothetical protein
VDSNRYLHGPAVNEALADENMQDVQWLLGDQSLVSARCSTTGTG